VVKLPFLPGVVRRGRVKVIYVVNDFTLPPTLPLQLTTVFQTERDSDGTVKDGTVGKKLEGGI